MRTQLLLGLVLSFVLLACADSASPLAEGQMSYANPCVGPACRAEHPDAHVTMSPVDDTSSSPDELMPAMTAVDAAANDPLPVHDAGSAQPHDAGTTTTEHDAGPPIACSDELPYGLLSPCETETEVCARWSTNPATDYDQYFACQCRAETSTSLVWDCYENLSGQVNCPHEEPENGSSCFGYLSSMCPYPNQTQCLCPIAGDDPRWVCDKPAPVAEPLDSIDDTKLVRDLSEAEQQRWCEWFLSITVPPGAPAPPNPPPTSAGYYPDNGCMGCGGGIAINGMIPPGLPVPVCMANLALSTCEAPVAELNDCARSMVSNCWPQPRGCTRYFEAGCSGTIIHQGASCPLRVR